MRTTYNKFPEVYVQGYDDEAWQGWASVHSVLRSRVSESPKTVLIIDCYPGVRLDELEQHLFAALNATVVINVESARRDEQALHELLARNLTDDASLAFSPVTILMSFLIRQAQPDASTD
ncbi:Uncharacterised protein [Citrobacter amalonaticus]|nr:Uncharacterised protein [Citrobacter amalonaticus]